MMSKCTIYGEQQRVLDRNEANLASHARFSNRHFDAVMRIPSFTFLADGIHSDDLNNN